MTRRHSIRRSAEKTESSTSDESSQSRNEYLAYEIADQFDVDCFNCKTYKIDTNTLILWRLQSFRSLT